MIPIKNPINRRHYFKHNIPTSRKVMVITAQAFKNNLSDRFCIKKTHNPILIKPKLIFVPLKRAQKANMIDKTINAVFLNRFNLVKMKANDRKIKMQKTCSGKRRRFSYKVRPITGQ